MVWEPNMIIQPVFQPLQSSCIHVCLSKSENECSVAMSLRELNKYEQMKSLANAYINKRKCSIQECVYHILPGQWLRKTFPHLIFANSNIPEKNFPLCLAEHEISELPEDSKKIFKQRMVGRYIDQPNLTSSSGKFVVIDAFCFAEFSR